MADIPHYDDPSERKKRLERFVDSTMESLLERPFFDASSRASRDEVLDAIIARCNAEKARNCSPTGMPIRQAKTTEMPQR